MVFSCLARCLLSYSLMLLGQKTIGLGGKVGVMDVPALWSTVPTFCWRSPKVEGLMEMPILPDGQSWQAILSQKRTSLGHMHV